MALQPCRECGQQVSTEAVTCPHCGVPQPTKAPERLPAPAPTEAKATAPQLGQPAPSSNSPIKLLGVGLGLAAIVALIEWYNPGAFDATPPAEKSVELRVAAVARGSFLHVASGEPRPVSDCKIRLNHDGLALPYEFYLGDLGPNEQRNIPLNEFLKGSDRFDPDRQAVTFLTISCLTPEGRGHTGWKHR